MVACGVDKDSWRLVCTDEGRDQDCSRYSRYACPAFAKLRGDLAENAPL
jgi:hypothetical protein